MVWQGTVQPTRKFKTNLSHKTVWLYDLPQYEETFQKNDQIQEEAVLPW